MRALSLQPGTVSVTIKTIKELNKAKNAFVLKLRSPANLMEPKAVFPLDWPVVVAAHIAENKLE